MRPRADTLLVWTGAACSYGCSFCPIEARSELAGIECSDLAQILAALEERSRLVVLVGGEPFLRPDILRLVATIRAAGGVPGMVTTGRPLVYPRVRQTLRRAGMAYVRFQLFGCGEVHDRAVAVPGAFEQALTAARAWIAEAGEGGAVDVALNVRRRPLATLVSEVHHLAAEIPSAAVQLVVSLDPDQAGEPREGESLRSALAALADWNGDSTRPLLAWEGVPESLPAASCLKIPPLRPRFSVAAPHACCLGRVDRLAAQSRVAGTAACANSFNFVRTATQVAWTPDADACTAHQMTEGVEPLRHLWLVEDDRVVRYVTDTADFAASEIAQVKDRWSHLFLDRAAAGVLDDFTEGMRRALPDPTCDPCANRARCGRRFRVIDGPPFAREEQWIATYVAGLRGRVLDVGCGEQLYRDELAPLVGSGMVDYTGLDPDELSLERLRAVLSRARLYLGGIEDFRGEPASYDHILCLRSLNHVVDLDEALARMAALLKPRGQLLIVETTPFAMLRRADQVAAADRAARAGHQHFRNLTSEEVLPLARRRSLRMLEHHPASLQTTNEWILLLGRAAG
jgi:SAM-dependent methyltransferase